MGSIGGVRVRDCVRWTASIAAIGALAVVAPARADAPDAQAMKISTAGHSLDWTWTPPGRSEHFGHGETLIHAPVAAVRKTVLDFGKYKDLGPDIQMSRVVGRTPDGSADVYIRIGVLNGMFSFWNITHFEPIQSTPEGDERLAGKMVQGKGNIDNSEIVWTLHPAGSDWTVLKFDVLLRPGVPAPQSFIDDHLRESAAHTVESVRDKLQGGSAVQPYTG
jgi:hypothetical protein